MVSLESSAWVNVCRTCAGTLFPGAVLGGSRVGCWPGTPSQAHATPRRHVPLQVDHVSQLQLPRGLLSTRQHAGPRPGRSYGHWRICMPCRAGSPAPARPLSNVAPSCSRTRRFFQLFVCVLVAVAIAANWVGRSRAALTAILATISVLLMDTANTVSLCFVCAPAWSIGGASHRLRLEELPHRPTGFWYTLTP